MRRALIATLEQFFSEADREEGDRLEWDDGVVTVHRLPTSITASIRDGGAEHQVFIDTGLMESAGKVRVHCTCGRGKRPCPHVWAALLAAERHDTGALLGSSGEAEAPPDPPWRSILAKVEQRVATEPAAPRPAETAPSVIRRIDWIIDLGRSVADKQLSLVIRQRQLRRDGTWGKPAAVDLDLLARSRDAQPDDARIAEILNRWFRGNPYEGGYGYYGWSGSRNPRWTAIVPEQLLDVVLPLLGRTGRCALSVTQDHHPDDAKPVRVDERAHRLHVRAEADEAARKWRIEASLRADEDRAGEDGAPGSLETALMWLGPAWVLLEDRFARIAPSDAPWVQSLFRQPPMHVPFSDRDELIGRLAGMPELPRLELGDTLRWDRQTGTPSPRLEVESRPSRNNLLARIWFDYGERRRRADSPLNGWYDATLGARIEADIAAENSLLEQVRESVGTEFLSDFPPPDADFEIKPTRLAHVVSELRKKGWSIEANGKPLRRSGNLTGSVRSSVDWFDLDAMVDYEGKAVRLPTLLEALQRGRNTIVLDDGTLGVVPEEWLRKYADWGRVAENKDGVLRFKASQALLLDALLASEASVDVDAKYDEIRRRMSEFRGIEAATPGKAFRGALRPYQGDGLGWLKFLEEFRLGGCLADDMGLGKTVQVLAHLASRSKSTEEHKPSLIVVPKTIVFNWIEEAERFAPKLRFANYTGLERAALRDRLGEFDVVVTTYGTMRRGVVELQKTPFDYVILDESQAIKNANALASKATRLLRADHRLAMTGTPIENHLGELWSLFEFLNPGLLGRSGAFETAVRNPQPDDETVRFLSKALGPYILRRTKHQVLKELPEKTEQTIYCDLLPKDRKYYNELRDYFRAGLESAIEDQGLNRSKIQVLEALLRLRQAACHSGLIDAKRINEPSAKIEALLEQVAATIEQGSKALVFSQFTSLLSIVKTHLDRLGIPYEYLDGRTRDRKAKVHRFQTEADCRLFLISLKAGGVGLNLTAADYVFILDPWWNPAAEAQAIDRAHRIGQTQRVFAYRLIARDTVEEKVVQLQESKRGLAEAIIRADNGMMRDLTADDLRLLLG